MADKLVAEINPETGSDRSQMRSNIHWIEVPLAGSAGNCAAAPLGRLAQRRDCRLESRGR